MSANFQLAVSAIRKNCARGLKINLRTFETQPTKRMVPPIPKLFAMQDWDFQIVDREANFVLYKLAYALWIETSRACSGDETPDIFITRYSSDKSCEWIRFEKPTGVVAYGYLVGNWIMIIGDVSSASL